MSILKIVGKRQFLYFRGNNSVPSTHAALRTAHDTTGQSMSLSNRVSRILLRPSVAELSARDPSGAGPIFAVSEFLVSCT